MDQTHQLEPDAVASIDEHRQSGSAGGTRQTKRGRVPFRVSNAASPLLRIEVRDLARREDQQHAALIQPVFGSAQAPLVGTAGFRLPAPTRQLC